MTYSLCRSIIVWNLLALFTLAATPAFAQDKSKGKPGSGSGSETPGPKFLIELANVPNSTIENFNDSADLLLRTEAYNGSETIYTYYLSTLDSGVRAFQRIRLPQGWYNMEILGMNNSRELVGWASYDPEGDGLDANGDGVLDDKNVIWAGIMITPDANDDGIWEMTEICPGPGSGCVRQINNDGDMIIQDDAIEGLVLLRRNGSEVALPLGFGPLGVGLHKTLSDRDANGDVAAVMSGVYYTPRKYETRTGLVTVLPTFDRATFVDAYAYSINSSGTAVGRADKFPAYWSPSGVVSKIPGWSTSKNATGHAFGINKSGEIIVSSSNQGPHLYRPASGLHPLNNAIVNPEAIPAGYQIYSLLYINNHTEITGNVRSDSGPPIPFVLYPVE